MARGRPRKTPARPRHFIREWIEHKGIDGQDLADELGIAYPTLTRLLAGDIAYTQQNLEPLAQILGVDAGDLISRDPTAPQFELYQVIDGMKPEEREQALRVIKAMVKVA